MNDFLKILEEHVQVVHSLAENTHDVEEVCKLLYNSLKANGTIFTCGNGGSAADAQHFTGELIGRFKSDRSAIASVCLNTNTTSITAIANDLGYDEIFSRQIQGIVKEKDVVVLFSTSGNSKNILNAIDYCNKKNISNVSFLGNDGGKAALTTNKAIIVNSGDTGRIQEAHILLIHYICEYLERHANDFV